MKLKINTFRTALGAYKNCVWATTDDDLFAPPRYKDEKPQRWLYGVVVKAPCGHFYSGNAIDADVEWNARLTQYEAVNVRCDACDAPETDEPAPRVFKAKITRWLGRHGFAVPLRGEADDVGSVYVTAGATCRHVGTRDTDDLDEWSVNVRRGAIVSLHDVRKGPKGHYANDAECPHCADDRRAHEAEEARLAAVEKRKREAKKRVMAMFEKGHKFDVGGAFPYFVKSSNMTPDVVSGTFLEAACKAVYEGAADDVVIAFAESEARKAYVARMDRSDAESVKAYYEMHDGAE